MVVIGQSGPPCLVTVPIDVRDPFPPDYSLDADVIVPIPPDGRVS